MTNSLTAHLMQNALGVSLLVVLIITVRCAVAKRIPASWLWAFWVLLIMRLVLPVTLESPTSLWTLLPSTEQPTIVAKDSIEFSTSAANSQEKEPIGTSTTGVGATAVTTKGGATAAVGVGDNPPSNAAQILPPPAEQDLRGSLPTLVEILAVIWALGFLSLLTCFAWRLWQMHRALKSMTTNMQPAALALLDECRKKMRLRRRIKLLESDTVGAPAMTGIFSPRILLPTGLVENLTEYELRHIFLHELAHVKRNDILVQRIADLGTAIHWWNPLVWLARLLWAHDRELACDDLAISNIALPDTPTQYGGTLLRIASGRPSKAIFPPTALAMATQPNQLSIRIDRIAKTSHRRSRNHWMAASIFVALATIGATNAPADKAGIPDLTSPAEHLKSDEVGVTLAIFRVSQLEGLNLATVETGFDEQAFQRILKLAKQRDGSNSVTLEASFRTNATQGVSTELTDMDPVSFYDEYGYDQDTGKFKEPDWEPETRGVGTRVTFSAQPSADRKQIDCKIALEHHLDRKPKVRRFPESEKQANRQMPFPPDFKFSEFRASAVLQPGQASLIQLLTNNNGTFAVFIRTELAEPKP